MAVLANRSSLLYAVLPSPVGDLLALGSETELHGLYMTPHTHGPEPDRGWVRDETRFADLAGQLEAYFAGRRTRFDVALAPQGTAFQRRVWAALIEIPSGQTTTYGRLAARLGCPSAARAVGLANGRNPISILIPCHRVVGANGSLTGYGGGLDRKRWLLDLEARTAGSVSSAH